MCNVWALFSSAVVVMRVLAGSSSVAAASVLREALSGYD